MFSYDLNSLGLIPTIFLNERLKLLKSEYPSKKAISETVLLFLGTKDPIVGDIEIAKQEAHEYPNINIYELESGHLIGSEHVDFVNEKINEFLLSQ